MTLGMAPTQNLPEVVNVRVGAMAPIIARGLVGVLATDPRLRVVDPEPDDSLLVAAVLREQPDVIVLGEAVAPELLSSIKEGCSLAAAMIVSAAPTQHYKALLASAGLAWLPRDATEAQICRAVHAAHKSAIARMSVIQSAASDVTLVPLTDRETEVFGYLQAGWSYARIAVRVHLAESTVKAHARKLRWKFGVKTSRELVGRDPSDRRSI
jgi:DNA-binding NarL/FixJ family response regulator